MKEIILASASPRRSELLRQVGITFKVVPSGVEENINMRLLPQELAQELACSKAIDVAKQAGGNCLVIGADTIVVKGKILGKPRNEEEAFTMLKSLEGEWHEVITGIAVTDAASMRTVKDFEMTRVKVRNLTDSMIYSYIKTGEPADKAGAYGIQGMGALLVERIEGCYFNVVGLPLMKLSCMLEEFGVKILY